MAGLFGAQQLVLQAILDAQGETSAFIEERRIAQSTQISPRDTRDWLLTLDHAGYVDLALTENGLRASVTARGRLALGLHRPSSSFPSAPPTIDPARARSRTGRERALVIGISDYPSPITKLPAVANDVREMASLLGSNKGEFPASNVRSLVDVEATRSNVLRELDAAFRAVQPDDPLFIYVAGHGAVLGGEYFFVAHDTRAETLTTTGVPLTEIKRAFDASPSQRLFMWLDFCYSGGILVRDPEGAPDDQAVIGRTLHVVQGQGKLIVAACTPFQKAWESAAVGHGLFTDALLRGLKGGAAKDGEVTVNSLFDFIDRQMGSERQRPMMFGQMTGRVILAHTGVPESGTVPSAVDVREVALSMVNVPQQQRDLIFICYSRADNRNPDFRDMLVRQLKAVNLAQGELQLAFFHDEQIKPGARWRDEIQRALSRTRVAVILEGPGLMASEFVQREEIPSVLEAAQNDAGITVFRVPVRHVSELLVPSALQGFQAAWPLNAPLSGLSGAKRDAALAKIVEKIVEAYVK